jgi:anion-transporting  ArsA/GET3 family ATPase
MTLALPFTGGSDARLMESRRRRYSHARGLFLHLNYDPRMSKRHVGLSARLKDSRICICAGSGGVGKTTTSAALALGLARRGQKVAVVTIDPAKRLAGALGLHALEGEPHRVQADHLAAHGIELRGELWAMTLDVKGTFDALVERHTPDEQAREQVLSNRIYHELSSAVSGSQEFTAVSKLYDLDRAGDFDVIVLDTPPSRNALDFLDAPARLTQFLDGRALKVFLAPGGFAARFLGRGTGLVLTMFSRVTGVDLFGEMSAFFRSLELTGMTERFSESAHGVHELLRDPATAFLIVTSPEPEPAQEAIFLAGKLQEAGMARAGLIVNRVHSDGLDGHPIEQLRILLAAELEDDALAARVAGNLTDFDVLVQRDRASLAHLSQQLGDDDPIRIAHLDVEMDLLGLVEIERRLFA